MSDEKLNFEHPELLKIDNLEQRPKKNDKTMVFVIISSWILVLIVLGVLEWIS